jgi:hypothetical protein
MTAASDQWPVAGAPNDWQVARIAPVTRSDKYGYWAKSVGKFIRVRPQPAYIVVNDPKCVAYEIHPDDFVNLPHHPGGCPVD